MIDVAVARLKMARALLGLVKKELKSIKKDHTPAYSTTGSGLPFLEEEIAEVDMVLKGVDHFIEFLSDPEEWIA